MPNVAPPSAPKTPPDRELMRASSPEDARRILGDGSFGGDYQKPDEVMLALWATGVEETREALEGPWPTKPLNDPIVIWGAGAIGGTLGAYWARAGVDVLLVDTAREHVEACRTTGPADRRTGRDLHTGRAGGDAG